MSSSAVEQPTGALILRKGREKPVLQRHPWLFSGAIQQVEGSPMAGDLVDVQSSSGQWLARAFYNPHSQIRGRILSWRPELAIDGAFWSEAIARAVAGRQALQLEPETTAYRLINAESDHLPGLIVDKYGEYLVFQSLAAGIELRKPLLLDLLARAIRPAGIIERIDASARQKEGLPLANGVVHGQPLPEDLTVLENGHTFLADLLSGHKTGLYLDQRDNRLAVCQPIHVAGKDVLNAFCYTGGFAIYAAAAGARTITNLDDSAAWLGQAERNLALNGPERPQDSFVVGDAFQVLRHYRDSKQQYDVIILDPPKFAHSQKDVNAACRGYKDLNWLALRLLRPGGLLATFSCSGLVSADLFQKVVFAAAVDAGRAVQIMRILGQAADHPILLTFPESAYLKGFLCRVY